MRLRRPQLTYANVTSTIALVIAMSGGAAYASHEFIDSSDVVDNTLTGEDIRGSFPDAQQGFIDGTLTTQDIADGTLFPSDIADNSLGPADILAVTGSDISPDSISAGHVANDSLDGFDVTNLSGSDLIDGSVGAADLAPEARGFTQTAERIGRRSFNRGQRGNIIATCPEGWRATGGGFSTSDARDPEDIVIASSYRYTRSQWIVVAEHVGGLGSPRIQVVATVMCAR